MSHNLGGSFQSFDLHRSDIHKHTILVRKNDTITSSKTFGSVSRKILIKHYTVHAEMRRAGIGTQSNFKSLESMPVSRTSKTQPPRCPGGCYGNNYFLAPFTAAFNVAPALNAGALEALILIASPVPGFRPFRAARFLTSKVPKPTKATLSPIFRAAVMMSISAPMALSASTFVLFVFVAIAAINSERFMVSPFFGWLLG